MARTIEQVQTEILTEKANHIELVELDSESNTAIWRLWIYITSTLIVYFEELMDLFKKDVQAIIDSNQYGTDLWWSKNIKAYQHGDLLAFIGNVYKYPVIDISKQIVKFCSVTSIAGKVQIKVAGIAGDSPVVLTGDQIDGLIDYTQEFRPSGIQFVIQSLQADDLKMSLNVYYNASGDINVIKPAVFAAINDYLLNLNTTQFNGTLYVNRLIDAIQAVPGVVNDQVEVLEIAAKNGADAYQVFTSRFQAKAGYFRIDPDFSLEASINFIT